MGESEAVVPSSVLGLRAAEGISACSGALIKCQPYLCFAGGPDSLVGLEEDAAVAWRTGVCFLLVCTHHAKCSHWLEQRAHSCKQHGWWFLGTLAVPFRKPSSCCLRTWFYSRSGNVRHTHAGAWRGCPWGCAAAVPVSPQHGWAWGCGWWGLCWWCVCPVIYPWLVNGRWKASANAPLIINWCVQAHLRAIFILCGMIDFWLITLACRVVID